MKWIYYSMAIPPLIYGVILGIQKAESALDATIIDLLFIVLGSIESNKR